MIACHSRVHGLSCDHVPGARRQAHTKVNPACDCPLIQHAITLLQGMRNPVLATMQFQRTMSRFSLPVGTAKLPCRLGMPLHAPCSSIVSYRH
jgi:hypothetical protein